ncbi:MAG TPA: DoxX family protein [Pirellulales bacterium]
MSGAIEPAAGAGKTSWVGVGISGLAVALLLLGVVFKLLKPEFQVEAIKELGWDESYLPVLAAIELPCILLYAFPRTAMLGAVLLTGYLGGAVASHVRVGDVFFGPLVPAALVWLGLYLRDPRVRAILPLS